VEGIGPNTLVRTGAPEKSIDTLARLYKSGTLEETYTWLVGKVQDYQIELNELGGYGHQGEPLSRNQIILWLKKDFKKSFPSTPTSLQIISSTTRGISWLR
jgi:hypothetical protein